MTATRVQNAAEYKERFNENIRGTTYKQVSTREALRRCPYNYCEHCLENITQSKKEGCKVLMSVLKDYGFPTQYHAVAIIEKY